MFISIEPEVCFTWEPVSVRIQGCEPGKTVRVEASLAQAGYTISRSEFQMVADEDGVIDFATTPSVSGSYTGVDDLGFIWSMENVGAAPLDLWRFDELLSIRAEQLGGDQVAQACNVRKALRDGVTVTPVSVEGAAAELFLPPDSNGSYIITFGGSDGGIASGRKLARFFASHGYPCLAISYFGLPGIAPELYAIPLEVIENAIAKVKEMPGFNGNIAVAGISRGGELSLLSSCYFSDIKATLAYVPSCIMWESEDVVAHGPSWSFRGEELPWVYCDWTGYESVQHTGEEWSCTPVYVKAMEQTDQIAAAMMPLEKIAGDVLLVSGQDDAIWNSSQLCGIARDYLADRAFPHRVEWLDYPNVGHGVFNASITSQMKSLPTFRGDCLKRGGDPSANAHAQADIRAKSLAFLAACFGTQA